jgi:hypothetical protein
MKKSSAPIAVASRSFCHNPILRAELLDRYENGRRWTYLPSSRPRIASFWVCPTFFDAAHRRQL